MLACATFSVWFILSDCCTAGVIYVDNRKGSDALNGAFSNLVDIRSGPVRTICRGLQLAANGDTIVLANNGMLYFESIQLVGNRHSGFGKRMFTIIGNGAIIDGAQRVPPAAWMPVAGDLWKLVPWWKGLYQLILDDRPVTEHPRRRARKRYRRFLPDIGRRGAARFIIECWEQDRRRSRISHSPFATSG